MINTDLQEVVVKWYVYKTYKDVYENLHKDIQADIDAYFDATGNYGQVLSNNDWAALCKEWASANSNYDIVVNYTTVYVDNGYSLLNEGGFYFDAKFTANTEAEAVFKACEWILENKDTK